FPSGIVAGFSPLWFGLLRAFGKGIHKHTKDYAISLMHGEQAFHQIAFHGSLLELLSNGFSVVHFKSINQGAVAYFEPNMHFSEIAYLGQGSTFAFGNYFGL